jgi:hypothetical protein
MMCMKRSLNLLLSGWFIALVGTGVASGQTGGGDNVAATWHFAGSTLLADNPAFANVKTMLTLQSSLEFRNLALGRFSIWLTHSLGWETNADASAQVRPLLDDLLSAESYWGLGGSAQGSPHFVIAPSTDGNGPRDEGGGAQGPLNFILAIQLDDKRAQVWQDHLRKSIRTPAESFKVQDFPGQRWNQAGGKSFWILRARDWTLVGVGEDLQSLQTQFLQQLRQQGRPGPALSQSWLEADLDWPRLVHWLPDSALPFKPARTKINLTVETNQLLALNATVHYPQPIPWNPQPWRVPYDLIRSPLISFATGQDIAAFMTDREPLSRLADNPLTGQFYVWALGQMGLQNYAAWPVTDATNTLQRIASQAPAAFNPDLARLQAGEFDWRPDRNALLWTKVGPVLFPQLDVAPETNGQYLLASFFPLNLNEKPAPAALFQQFIASNNIVYYDWEGTGPRLDQWRLLAGLLPLFPKIPQDAPDPASTNKTAASAPAKPPVIIEENWLAGLKPMLMKNTVTQVTRLAPDELAVVRKSPLGVTALELVVLSHWFSGAGSTGLMPGLLPPPAKVSGPGAR